MSPDGFEQRLREGLESSTFSRGDVLELLETLELYRRSDEILRAYIKRIRIAVGEQDEV